MKETVLGTYVLFALDLIYNMLPLWAYKYLSLAVDKQWQVRHTANRSTQRREVSYRVACIPESNNAFSRP